MTRIHRDDDIAVRISWGMGGTHRLYDGRSRIGGRGRNDAELTEGHDKTRKATCLGCGPGNTGAHRGCQANDDAQRSARAHAGMNVCDQSVSGRHARRARQSRVRQVDDFPIRPVELEDLLRGGCAENERDLSALRRRRQVDVA